MSEIEQVALRRMFSDNLNDIPAIMRDIKDHNLFLIFMVFTVI